MIFSWTCPYCHRDTTVTDANYNTGSVGCFIQDWQGKFHSLRAFFIICPNRECKRLTLSCNLQECANVAQATPGDAAQGVCTQAWQLLPPSSGKPFPDYIPLEIRQDYGEACLIKNFSPKASATVARRCLQGMIQNFWQVKKRTLAEEINAIRDKVDPDMWEAIDAVRKVGNIGAHMEKDVNLIVDIEPQEVEALIGLIEILFQEWYINRHKRKQHTQELKRIAENKTQQKNKQNGNP